ncbi:EscI/YscI/HrpB family type III secretion system inner rod protein [Pseudoduganella sp. HUAS MS19]
MDTRLSMAVQGAASGLAGKPAPQIPDAAAAGEGAANFKVQLQVQQQQFRSGAQQDLAPPGIGQDSLAAVMAERAAGLAGDVNRHQQYVSRMLERATASGDSLHLMHAMLALNDYQLRVQTISKVVSRASSSVDSLTKLQ